ncbi:MAG: rubrerythrin family protein [Desulfovibrionaceae bacterium]|jgi:rubrerythrin|nr:rubrerythrin family protein [Desulfovibrionaceae bacterium]
MSKTQKNLSAAFAGESQANRKYLAFAAQADKEGFAQVAKLFRATAEAETIHAHAHFRLLKGVGSTAENLQSAIDGETYEFTKMYPEMIADAEAEGEKAAARYMGFANTAEELHANLYKRALADPSGMAAADYYVCSVCGHIHAGAPTEKCPICGAKETAYFKAQ